MTRALDPAVLSRAYDECIVAGVFQETGDYYVRYRSRYEGVLHTYAALHGDGPLDVLEIGGGQHALLAHAVLGDSATVADLPGPHLTYLRSRDVCTVHWDLLGNEQLFRGAFDRVFLCEVMSHLPVPPHEYLARIRIALRPGGVLLVSTPNLHRIRNIALLVLGREPFSPMVKPEPGTWLGSFLDFSAEHLRWQLDRAGFVNIDVERREFGHRASLGLGPSGQPRLAADHVDPSVPIQLARYGHRPVSGGIGGGTDGPEGHRSNPRSLRGKTVWWSRWAKSLLMGLRVPLLGAIRGE